MVASANEKPSMNLREILPLAGIAVAAFIFNTSEFMPVALLTDIATSFSVSEAQAGLIISVYAWMVMLLSLPLMILASRVEFKRLLLVVIAVFLVGQILSAVSATYEMLMASRICVACAHAVFWSIAAPVAIRVVSEDHRHAAMGVVVMGSSVALIAGLPLGRVIGLVLGWRMTFACVAAVSALVLIYIKVFLPQISATKPFSVKELPDLIRVPALQGIYIFVALIITGYYLCYSYIEPFLLQTAALEETVVTGVIAVFGVAGIAGSMLFSKYYAHLRLKFLFAAAVGILIALCLLDASSNFVVAVLIICGVLGLCATALNVALQSEVILNSSLDTQAVATSIYSGIFNLGIGCGSALGGIVVSIFGIETIGFMGGVIVALALAYYMVALRSRLRISRI